MIPKYKISFVMPEGLYHDFREQIIKNKYGIRGKSAWVCDALNQLPKKSNFEEMVKLNDEMHCLNKPETISIDLDTKKALEKAVISVRIRYPELEGVKSRIIRTAILHRLLSKA